MPLLLVAAFVISFLNRVLLQPFLIQRVGSDEQFSLLALSFFGGTLTTLFLTPILVALHRFAILREITSISFITMHEDAIIEYFITSIAMNFCFSALHLISLIKTDNNVVSIISLLVSFAISCFFTVWVIRFSLVFPAIAVRAPNVSLRGSARATKGVFWRLVFLMMVPVCLAVIAGYTIDGYLTKLRFELLGAAAMAFCMAIGLAIATMTLSHVYLWRSTGPFGRR